MTEQSTTTLLIADASGDDLDAVMQVMRDAFDSAFGEGWTRAQCAGILPMSGVVMTLARQGDLPVGFTLARRVADEAELLLIAVAPDARGRGVASALMRRFIDDAAARGIHRLHLEVRDGNPAVALYSRHQFQIHGRRANYYRGRDGRLTDALTMGRTLDN
jgi:ribosomal-protein-alanine N-acetyltransferase